MNEKVGQNQPPLPAELVAAIERARQRTTTPELVAKLMSKAITLKSSMHPTAIATGTRIIPWLQVAGIAASVLLVLSYGSFLAYRFATHVDQRDHWRSAITYSPVTKNSLVLVGYRIIDEDMDRADAKAEEVSAALEVAALRREIQTTLDKFRDWSDRE